MFLDVGNESVVLHFPLLSALGEKVVRSVEVAFAEFEIVKGEILEAEIGPEAVAEAVVVNGVSMGVVCKILARSVVETVTPLLRSGHEAVPGGLVEIELAVSIATAPLAR